MDLTLEVPSIFCTLISIVVNYFTILFVQGQIQLV